MHRKNFFISFLHRKFLVGLEVKVLLKIYDVFLMKILGWIHFSLALWGLSLSNNLGNGMDNNFYDELKKFLNNIENPFRPVNMIFSVTRVMSQDVRQF